MLSFLFEIAARPGRRNLHNLSSGVEPWPFSRPRRHHLHNRQKPEPRWLSGTNAPRKRRP